MKQFDISNILFYLILLFLPTQLGKHFWPSFSLLDGVRIDYLSPTVYMTDILIFLLFILWLISNLKSQISKPNLKSQNFIKLLVLNCGFEFCTLSFALKSILTWKALFVLIFLLVGVLLSRSPMLGFYGLLKLTEFIFLGFYIAKKRLNVYYFFLVLSLGIFFESVLAIAQYVHQSSIGGLLYLLGERTFTAQTPGIANASINGELILRPYGTFPHPNVLAAYLLITMALTLLRITYYVSRIKKIFFLLSLMLGTIALFLTMSRVATIIWLVVIGYLLVKFVILNLFQHLRENRFRNKFGMTALMFLFVIICSIFVFLSPLYYRFAESSFLEESATLRIQLMQSSILMILDNPIFGVGINNFLTTLPAYTSFKANNFFQSLQPVHNIFLLIAVQTGIAGFLFSLWFIKNTFKKIKNPCLAGRQEKLILHCRIKNLLFLIVIILGMFDHYFLTLQQGQLLMAVVLGLCWNTIRIDQDNSKRDNKR